jgi:RHS repeat-associated protein
MADEVGVIHMNGRIYDPRLARFLQADPFVQSPSDTQMYNRYSYTRNNPLNAADPSGYFISAIAAIVAYAATGNVAVAVIAAGITATAVTLARGGTFKQALISGISAAALTYVGGEFIQSGADIFSNAGGIFVSKIATIGGIAAQLQGGNFGHGFVTAGVSAFVGSAVGMADWVTGLDLAPQVAVKTIVGGTLSEVSGGKFANGALSAGLAAAANMTVAALKSAFTGNPSAPNLQQKTDAKMTELTSNELLDDQVTGESQVKMAYSFRSYDSPPELTEVRFLPRIWEVSVTAPRPYVALPGFLNIDTGWEVTGSVDDFRAIAQLHGARNFANAANNFVVLTSAAIVGGPAFRLGMAQTAVMNEMLGKAQTPESLIVGGAISRTLSPLGGYVGSQAAQAHPVGVGIWRANTEVLSIGLGLAGP